MSTPSTRSSTDAGKAPLKIIKLGGSLLDLPDCIERLSTYLETQPHGAIVVGGGQSADLVRQWNHDGRIDKHESHWLAIAAMTFNASQLARDSCRFELAASRNDVDRIVERSQTPVLDVLSFLRRESAFSTIPKTWDVTSDSISAIIASQWNAGLCLLKSVDPGSNPMEHLDPYFANAAVGLDTFEWINLRAEFERPNPVRLSPLTLQAVKPTSSQQVGSL